MPLTEFLIRAAVALLLGSLIGAERQWHHRLAGLKTNALVCTGAALFVSTGYFFRTEPDSPRIAAQVVSGIGFLGAGLMFRDGLTVKGLNTAATLWCAAAVGVLTGIGALREAVVATVLIVVANVLLREVATRMDLSMGFGEPQETRYRVTATGSAAQLALLRERLGPLAERLQLQLQSLEQRPREGDTTLPEQLDVELSADHPNYRVIEKLCAALDGDGVRLSWAALNDRRRAESVSQME